MSYSLAICSYVFKISRLLRDVEFTINLTHGDKLIGRFYYILHSLSNKNLRLPLYQHYPNQFLVKERRKRENLSLKSFVSTSEQPFARHFLLVVAMFAPWRSQKSVRKPPPNKTPRHCPDQPMRQRDKIDKVKVHTKTYSECYLSV